MSQAKPNTDAIKLVLSRIEEKANKGELDESERTVLAWSKNLDRGHAWWIMLALFSAMCTTNGPYRIYSLIFARITSKGTYSREEASWPVSMIVTLESLAAPLVYIVADRISYKQTYLIGSLLLIAGNGFAALSSSLWLDTLLIGVVQGVGFSFLSMKIMEIVNSYFIRYRSLALGFIYSGGTPAVFVLSPIIQWLLEAYPWRYSYLGIAIFCSLNLFMIPLLKPNPIPEELLNILERQGNLENKKGTHKCESAGSDVEACRDMKAEPASDKEKVVVIQLGNVVTPINRCNSNSTRLDNELGEMQASSDGTAEAHASWDVTLNLLDLAKTPAFYLICLNQLLYFWLFTVWCLVMVDYGLDRGFTPEQAKWLLEFQAIGELLGRLVLSLLIDMHFISIRYCNILTLFLLAGFLVAATLVQSYTLLAAITMAFSALVALLYIQLNGLLIEHLGEDRVTIGLGFSYFISGLLIIFRPQVLGYFRDQHGKYEPLLIWMAGVCFFGALLWLIEPLLSTNKAKYKRPEMKARAGGT